MPTPASSGARLVWLAYAGATTVGALTILAIYVNAYDDYDISEKLRATGAFARKTMGILSFPLGAAASAIAGDALDSSLACGHANEPCAIFVDWNLRFAAIVSQVAVLRWLITLRR